MDERAEYYLVGQRGCCGVCGGYGRGRRRGRERGRMGRHGKRSTKIPREAAIDPTSASPWMISKAWWPSRNTALRYEGGSERQGGRGGAFEGGSERQGVVAEQTRARGGRGGAEFLVAELHPDGRRTPRR
jgi:hypothetical protein